MANFEWTEWNFKIHEDTFFDQQIQVFKKKGRERNSIPY